MFADWKKGRMNDPLGDSQEENTAPDRGSQSLEPAPELLASAKHPIHNLFVGPAGLRSGWRVALFVLIAAVIAFALVGATSRWHPQGAGRLWQGWLSELELFLAVAAASLLMARIEKRPWGSYGLPARGMFGKNFWAGALWGFLWLTVMMLLMRAAGVFYFGGLAIHGARILKFAAFYGLLFLTVGFFEESLMRGYAQFTLTQGLGFWPAAILLSALFGALHLGNSGEAWLGILAAALIGLFLCLTLRRTGTLWFAVGFHASWDWGESYLYSVPDSGAMVPGHLLNSSFHGPRWLTGGSVGPEGSVLVLLIIALMWVVFDRSYREAKYQVGSPIRTRSETLQPAS
jgi:hypothetical protein